MKSTRLERRLFLEMLGIILRWGVALWLIISSSIRLWIIPAVVGGVWLYFTSFGCCENGYIPRYHYFFRYRFKHSYTERFELNRQFYSIDYVRIGEGVFTKEHLIFANFGVILHYSEIEKITLSKNQNLNVVTIFLTNKKKYLFNISQPEFTGNPSLFDKALKQYEQFQNEKSERNIN